MQHRIRILHVVSAAVSVVVLRGVGSETKASGLREIRVLDKAIHPEFGVNLVLVVEVLLHDGIGGDLEFGGANVFLCVFGLIGLIGYGKDLDLGHDSLRLVYIPGGLGIGGILMLPSGCQLGKSAGNNGVFSTRVTER